MHSASTTFNCSPEIARASFISVADSPRETIHASFTASRQKPPSRSRRSNKCSSRSTNGRKDGGAALACVPPRAIPKARRLSSIGTATLRQCRRPTWPIVESSPESRSIENSFPKTSGSGMLSGSDGNRAGRPHRCLSAPEDSVSLQTRSFFLHGKNSANVAASLADDLGADGIRTRKAARVEAVLFVSDSALSARRLAQLATLADSAEVARIVEQLNLAYDRDASAFRIERAANGY